MLTLLKIEVAKVAICLCLLGCLLAPVLSGQVPGGTGNPGSVNVLSNGNINMFAGTALFCSLIIPKNTGQEWVQFYCYTDWTDLSKRKLVTNATVIVPPAGLTPVPAGQVYVNGTVVENSLNLSIVTIMLWRRMGDKLISYQIAVNGDSNTITTGSF